MGRSRCGFLPQIDHHSQPLISAGCLSSFGDELRRRLLGFRRRFQSIHTSTKNRRWRRVCRPILTRSRRQLLKKPLRVPTFVNYYVSMVMSPI